MPHVKDSKYNEIFSHLCHFLALSKEVKLPDVLDELIVSAMALDQSLKFDSQQMISEAVSVFFNVDIPGNEFDESMDRLIETGRVLRDGNEYYLPAEVLSGVLERNERATELEETVKAEWLDQLEEQYQNLLSEDGELLWELLKSYMAKAFKRHGAQTIRILDPKYDIPPEVDTHLSVLLDHTLKESELEITQQMARDAISSFYKSTTASRTKYLAQLLDGTFSFFALTADEITSDYLKSSLVPMLVFLDTNFIFGILDLHVNPMIEVSHELIDIIESNNLPFDLCYHKATLEEMQRTIGAIGDSVRGRRWSSALSRAAVKNNQISGIEFRYHEMNAKEPTDPEAFFDIYEHPKPLLDERGFKLFEPSKRPEDYIERKGDLLARYREFIEGRRRPKPDAAYNHDMTVWLDAHDLRRSGDSVLESGVLFLTCDYHLYAFDRELHNRHHKVGMIVLPNHFLQMLRPFVPATDDFDRRFVETFAIPEFRTIGSDYSETVSKVLSYLAVLSDVSEETATRILADRLLIENLKGVDENSAEFRSSIESALAADNERLLEEVTSQKKEIQKVKTKLEETQVHQQELIITSVHKERLLEDSNAQLELEKQIRERERQEAAEREHNLQAKIDQSEQQRLKYQRRFRILIGSTIVILGFLLLFGFSPLQRWNLLATHPSRNRIYFYISLLIIASAWAIIDLKRRNFAIGTIVVDIVFALTDAFWL
jgi:hypothetical protein